VNYSNLLLDKTIVSQAPGTIVSLPPKAEKAAAPHVGRAGCFFGFKQKIWGAG
jgi:hypothetical protein